MSRHVELKSKIKTASSPKKPWKRNCSCQNQVKQDAIRVSAGGGGGNKKETTGREKNRKNFIRDNICSAINMVAHKPQPAQVDTRRGAKQSLKNSGLQHQYVQKSNYGQVPPYLLERKDEQKKQQETYESFLACEAHRETAKQISDDERVEILKGLQDNWNLLNRQFLSISLTLDTYQKQTRKRILETRMKQLEKDMDLFRNADIFVMND